jgi:hypothetical protein
MSFKMKNSVENIVLTNGIIEKRSLEKNVHGLTLDDGTIVINSKLSPVQQKIAEGHEKVHREQILKKDLSYDEDFIYWKGEKYDRNKIKEGFPKLEWEQEAYNRQNKM